MADDLAVEFEEAKAAGQGGGDDLAAEFAAAKAAQGNPDVVEVHRDVPDEEIGLLGAMSRGIEDNASKVGIDLPSMRAGGGVANAADTVDDAAAGALHGYTWGTSNWLPGARETLAKSKARSPVAAEVGDIGGQVLAPGLGKLGPIKGARGLVARTLYGAGEQALRSGTMAAADDGDVANQAGIGALFGAGGSLAAEVPAYFGGARAADKIRKAEADAAKKFYDKSAKVVRQRTSGLGGDLSGIVDEYNNAKRIASSASGPDNTWQMISKAKKNLSDPAYIQAYVDAVTHKLEDAGAAMAGRVQTSRNALASAKAALTPEAIEAGAEEMMANPLSRSLLPKAIRYLKRAPVAIGGAIGGPTGAAAGAMAAERMGDIGTAAANSAKDPGMRRLAGRVTQKVTGPLAESFRRMSRLGPALSEGTGQ